MHGTKFVLQSNLLVLSALDEDERSTLDAIVTLGQQLGSAQPLTITAETLNAVDTKARLSNLEVMPWVGPVLYRDNKSTEYAGLFSAKALSKKVFHWHTDPIALRLDPPVMGKALFIKGAPTEGAGLTVVINGVHTIKIDGIPKNGAVVCLLPADLKLMDLRFAPVGNVQSTGIMLIK